MTTEFLTGWLYGRGYSDAVRAFLVAASEAAKQGRESHRKTVIELVDLARCHMVGHKMQEKTIAGVILWYTVNHQNVGWNQVYSYGNDIAQALEDRQSASHKHYQDDYCRDLVNNKLAVFIHSVLLIHEVKQVRLNNGEGAEEMLRKIAVLEEAMVLHPECEERYKLMYQSIAANK